MARVLRTDQARVDLKSIGQHIAEQSQSRDIALSFLDRIEEKCELYATQPLMGEARPDLADDLHCFPVADYIVFYRPLVDGILVLTVVHGARDIPAVFRYLFGPRREA